MLLVDNSVTAFISETSSSSPAPGGGSISALSGASAAALLEMVSNLTLSKEKYADVFKDMEEIKKECEDARIFFIDMIDKDSDSFNAIMSCFKLPKDTDEQKQFRSAKIQEGYKKAVEVPLGVGKRAYSIMKLGKLAIEKGNPNSITDAAVAVMQAKTAVLGAFYNVKINLGSIKDMDFVQKVQAEVEDIEKRIESEEKEILSMVKL